MSQELSSATTGTTGRRVGVWTPIILSLLCVAALFLPNRLMEGSFVGVMIMFYGPMLCALLFLIWWLFFSKTSWIEKFAALGWTVAMSEAAVLFAHSSMKVALMMYLPSLILVCWTLALVLFRNPWARQIAVPLSLIPAVVLCSVLRFEGVTGAFDAEFSFIWEKTAEQKYLASREATKKDLKKELAPDAAKPLQLTAGDWPAFRGPQRDSILRGVKIRTDWDQRPPKELWRKKIGPAWSSLTVVGNRVFTQEQQDSNEAVLCFDLDTGKEVWSHIDAVRFEEPVGGPGPRATPTFDGGRLFTLGAKGILNAFDAATGKRLWSHDLVKELDAPVPMWGFSSSPLVYGDKVAVFTGAKDKGVAVYSAADGKPAWAGGMGGHSYSSTHFAKLAGADALINTTNKTIQGLDPATGKVLWNHDWDVGDVVHCVQPALLSGDRVAIGAAFGIGTRVFNVEKSGDKFATKDLGTFASFKPYYSDFVVIDDIAFGFDGAIFGCYDLKDGKKLWRGGRYGSGQVLLLADQNLLLVVTETDGRVVLIPADKSGHKEIAKFKALTGKTWNHPTVAHGKLLVRNAEEIACFDVAEK